VMQHTSQVLSFMPMVDCIFLRRMFLKGCHQGQP
jgi:hypothetical protein